MSLKIVPLARSSTGEAMALAVAGVMVVVNKRQKNMINDSDFHFIEYHLL